MSDVERYGLWAVIGFTGILVLIGLGGDDEPLQREVLRPRVVEQSADDPRDAARSTPERVPRKAVTPRASERDATPARVMTVPPVAAGTEGFRWEESPVAYPGPRAARAPASGDRDARLTHTIAPGETLGDIASRYYGTSTRWHELLALNPGLEPKRLKPGQVIVVQGASPGGPVALAATTKASGSAALKAAGKAGDRTYVVRAGDTLGEIAAKMLGSSRRSTELYEANRHVLSGPDQLKVGQVLTLP